MVNRERFMLDVDSEGFPIPDHTPFAVLNIGKLPDVQMAQSILADARCLNCPPLEQCPRSGYCETRGAQHLCVCIAGLSGQPCTCKSVERAAYRNPKGWDQIDGTPLPEITWAAEQNALSNAHVDGITRLSDSYAPDAFYGWKS